MIFFLIHFLLCFFPLQNGIYDRMVFIHYIFCKMEKMATKNNMPMQPCIHSSVVAYINNQMTLVNFRLQEMKKQGVDQDRLQLLCGITGAFRPGVLTALVGVSGAGKTTLMDVLAGRKTGGYIEGDIHISGFPKNQATFARISGYCEQNDIHSPQVTVRESVIYSAWLRLPAEIDHETREVYIQHW